MKPIIRIALGQRRLVCRLLPVIVDSLDHVALEDRALAVAFTVCIFERKVLRIRAVFLEVCARLVDADEPVILREC